MNRIILLLLSYVLLIQCTKHVRPHKTEDYVYEATGYLYYAGGHLYFSSSDRKDFWQEISKADFRVKEAPRSYILPYMMGNEETIIYLFENEWLCENIYYFSCRLKTKIYSEDSYRYQKERNRDCKDKLINLKTKKSYIFNCNYFENEVIEIEPLEPEVRSQYIEYIKSEGLPLQEWMKE